MLGASIRVIDSVTAACNSVSTPKQAYTWNEERGMRDKMARQGEERRDDAVERQKN